MFKKTPLRSVYLFGKQNWKSTLARNWIKKWSTCDTNRLRHGMPVFDHGLNLLHHKAGPCSCISIKYTLSMSYTSKQAFRQMPMKISKKRMEKQN